MATISRRLIFSPVPKKLFRNCQFLSTTKKYDSKSSTSSRLDPCQSASMLDIGTRRIFNEEHDIFRQTVRRFMVDEVVPNHPKWEEDGQVSKEVWQKAGTMGFLGIDTPEEHGGIGGDFITSSIVMEEQSYCNCSGLGWALHSHIVMPYISHYGNKEQIEKFLPKMTAGQCIGAIAMTEPGAGSDLQGVRTSAKKDGTDYILNGSKVYITNGYMSDLVIVVAITNPSAKSTAHGISLFLVEEGMKGFVKGKKLKKMGLKAQDTAELFFEDVRLPKSSLLGEENKGFYYLMKELPQERLLIAVMGIASCEYMFEETRKYLSERKAFGKTLSKLQVIQHKMAELKTEIACNRAFVDRCIELHNEGKLDSSTASMVKYWVSELQNRVAYQCVQLHGGMGYMMECGIARAYLDARVQPIYGGSSEIMKELIARQIFS
ncbi:long-chain specific acyl-CoA dehydrogenase mitochondrial [Biomphalaria glabrata]|uniref:Long-chain specific acyl-CoA dehydrogenase, mitochondrial n=1 Tax=Biomphalaria glabrata TaxID=6526 RepID=A0A2C9KB74_BIOGL|nr:long-chain specific acyl-CoA dehydrogenase, mitochondrial-like isoform X1 [Biomphalaria glabrata]KAI8730243.1 long-chain specific acyl-CoA dehydrogenase; mitochondrial-like [Biomphalaria glabrata]KAI8778426.1 long-chain specific acyl-CoA dehydrogenase, mitochondrial [Biomphalaria glabrata]